MMYSQQEYDMMRRQTLQVEAEKRAIFKTLLTGVSIILALSLLILGYLYRQYSQSSSLISAAEARAALAESQFQQANQELQDKRAQLEGIAQREAQRNEKINTLVPAVMRKGASDSEIASLAHAIYETPGRVIELPGIPPDSILRRYRYRSGGEVRAYVLVAGNVNGKWLLYSNLVARATDK
jgi:hypothetical protein